MLKYIIYYIILTSNSCSYKNRVVNSNYTYTNVFSGTSAKPMLYNTNKFLTNIKSAGKSNLPKIYQNKY
jgi:hypothetical protein